MKTSHIAILTIIGVIGLGELGPKIVDSIGNTGKVDVGDVWLCRVPLLVFEDNHEVGEITQTTYRKVVDVHGSTITYVIPNDTTKYTMDVDEFTFNGKGMTTHKIRE